MNKVKKVIYIKGMHCTSCEMIIKQSAEKIEGVKVQYISANKGEMGVELSNESILPQVEKTITDAGYKISDNQPHVHRYNFDRLLISIGIVGILAFIVYKLDVVQYIPSIGDNLSFGVALLMGLIASVSTCLAIVGSIVI